MLKEAVSAMKLEPELRADFIEKVEAADRPASQIMREPMRDYVRRQREARQYDKFLRKKVDAARASVQARAGRSNEEVESAFAARRTQALKNALGSSPG
jgi:epoxyqueuosine reductase QueG